MPDAELHQIEKSVMDYTAEAAYTGGTVIQLRDGRAAVLPADVASGESGGAQTEGVYNVTKAASQVWIDGAPIWWDHSANAATCIPPLTAGDRDFYLGTAVGDVASATTEGKVNLNVQPVYEIDMQRDGGDTAVVLTAGSPYLYSRGGALEAGFSLTAEAQKLDWLSKRSFALGSNWILEAVVEVVTNADADVADLSIGVANATHASDADSITESVLFHFDLGADLNIDAESDDGTTEVAATDSTIDYTEGTPFEVWFDLRDPSDIQVYIDGVLALGSTVFKLNAATGPLKLLVHVEKTSSTDTYELDLERLSARIAQQ
jgi:predicted RecA/RadA family phage recombinase